MAVTPEQLARQLYDAGHELDELAPANEAAGRAIIAAARPPQRSGAMAAGQTVKATATGAAVFSTARYWTFVHYGAPRRNLRARPWLSQAIPPARDDVLAVYAKLIGATLDKIG